MASREQKLIDITFQLVLTATSPRHEEFFKNKSQEEIAAWVTEQLKGCGFCTDPVGSSWGYLKPCEDRDDGTITLVPSPRDS